MFLTDRKLERRIEELEAYRYRDRFSLECLQIMEDIQGKVNPVLPEAGRRCELATDGKEETLICGCAKK